MNQIKNTDFRPLMIVALSLLGLGLWFASFRATDESESEIGDFDDTSIESQADHGSRQRAKAIRSQPATGPDPQITPVSEAVVAPLPATKKVGYVFVVDDFGLRVAVSAATVLIEGGGKRTVWGKKKTAILKSDGEGRFVLPKSISGSFSVRVWAKGFIANSFEFKMEELGEDQPIELEMFEEQIALVSVRMAPISGGEKINGNRIEMHVQMSCSSLRYRMRVESFQHIEDVPLLLVQKTKARKVPGHSDFVRETVFGRSSRKTPEGHKSTVGALHTSKRQRWVVLFGRTYRSEWQQSQLTTGWFDSRSKRANSSELSPTVSAKYSAYGHAQT